jgi:hypothetical protein
MTEEDDVFLKIMNQKRDASAMPCTEDIFEEVMNFFEETAQTKQPYASVDNPPVLSFADMQDMMDASLEDSMKPFAKEIYEHWKSRRMAVQNNPLVSQLKVSCLACHWRSCPTNIPQFETGQDTDDSDPFVCFRRREVRQIRKTRGRDAQSAEKLRRLRKELEDARELVALVRQREIARKEMLSMEKKIFEQRAQVKEMKRKLNVKDDDEDLINQKVSVAALAAKNVHMLTYPHSPRRECSRCLNNVPTLPNCACLSRLAFRAQRTCSSWRKFRQRKKTRFCAISSRISLSTSNGTRDMWITLVHHYHHPPKGHSMWQPSDLLSQRNCPLLPHQKHLVRWIPL